MKQRLTALVLGAVITGGAFAASAQADVDVPAPQPMTTQAQRYWACVALDHVHVGACVENPLPDPGDHGSLRSAIREITGLRSPV